MDFLNRTLAQLSDLFRSLTPGARITSALLLAVLVVSLVWLFNVRTAGPDGYLLGGYAFPPGDMPAVQGALAKKGLNFEVEGQLIRIPNARKAEYIAALADADVLPSDSLNYMAQMVKDTSLFASSKTQEQAWRVARSRTLSDTIRRMSGIESAQVFVDEQKPRGFNRQEIFTASVNVKPLGSRPLEEEQVRSIRKLVAGAVAGLTPEKVTVVDSNTGRNWSDSTSGGLGSGSDDEYISRMREYQRHYERAIRETLAYVPGVTVTVNVELERERRRTEEKVDVNPKPIQVHSRAETRSNSSESTNPAGRPGLAAQQESNQPAQLRTASAAGNRSQEEQSVEESQSVVSSETTLAEFVGLTPNKVTAAIGIPGSYIENLWRQQNPTATGQVPALPDAAALAVIEQQEIAKIRAHALNCIHHQPGIDPAELITVSTFASLPGPEIPAEPLTDRAVSWMAQSWQALGLLGLAGFSLLMLRSMVRSAPAPRRPPAAEDEADESNSSPEAVAAALPAAAARRLKLRGDSPSIRDELAEIVKEDPDTAANILRTWIGEAG